MKGVRFIASILSFSLLTAGCRSDEAESRRGLSTTALRANRVTAPVVGEPRELDEADAGSITKRSLDAGLAPATPLGDRERLGSDGLTTRDSSGVILDAEWRWSDVPGPANAPETVPDALDALRANTKFHMRIEIAAAGRMSISFLGHGFPWSSGTELRSRTDRLGHVLVWPDARRYRNVVAGALRALFADRRLDRGSLFTPKVTIGAPGSVLGQATARHTLLTPVGELQIEQTSLPGVGPGALLLCRFLVELMGVDPNTSTCTSEQLALRASLTSAPGGKLQFVVNQLSRKQDLALSSIQVPPENASFETSGIPVPTQGSVPRASLAALRTHPTANPNVAKDAPSEGLLAVNRTLGLRALLVDGIVVAWLAPGTELAIPELKNGNYSVAWRDFFGTAADASKIVSLPARVTLGKPADMGGG